MLKILILVLLPLSFGRKISLDDYCKVDKKNTPCYFGCGRSSKCGKTEVDFKVLTNDLRECILNEHNIYRNDAAGGKWTDLGLKTMSNMLALSYDKETEFVAGCYIKQCLKGHDTVRKALNGESMGQNLFGMSASAKIEMDCNLLKKSLRGWVDGELKFLNTNNTLSFSLKFKFIHNAGHLTQVLWSNTAHLGCAMLHSFKAGKKTYSYDIFCNYRPSGNIINQLMYTGGDAGESCSTKNEKYPNLCGNIRPISDDNFEPPVDLSRYEDIQRSVTAILIALSTLFALLY